MELNSLYQEVILDHYKRPHHKGLVAGDIQVHHINPSCGDEITLSLKVVGDEVSNLTWDGVGCSISQASVSIMSDLLIGKKIGQASLVLDSFVEMMQSKGQNEGDEAVLSSLHYLFCYFFPLGKSGESGCPRQKPRFASVSPRYMAF